VASGREAGDQARKDRIAKNEALFREVNERVRAVSDANEPERVGFLCECGDDSCTETVELTAREYEGIRAEPTHFVVVPAHEIKEVEDVIERREGYLVVRKHPEEEDIALATDPRS
jgi:hypothetical protein